jgi:ferredoxin
LVLIGTDPYLLDLAAANIAGFPPHKLRLLHAAEQAGYITPEYHQFLLNLPISNFVIPGGLQEPKVNPLVAFIHHPKRQKYFLRIRQTAFFTALCQTTWVGQLLFWSGLRQDKFLGNELNCDKIYVLDTCTNCMKCHEYCPMHLPLPEALKPDSTLEIKSQCIKCMYCYMVCPERAIAFDGEPGFFAEQQRQYDDIVRKIT